MRVGHDLAASIAADSGDVPLDPAIVLAAAKIAGIPEEKHKAFRSQLTSAVREAQRASKAPLRRFTAADARSRFASLRQTLQEMKPQRDGEAAGRFLSADLSPMTIDHLLRCIDHAERRAVEILPARGRPKGYGGPGFDSFTMEMVVTAQKLGGRLTRNLRDGRVSGGFMKLLGLLSDVLPLAFVPSERVVKRAFDRAMEATK
jgi:hypothetical protein